MIEAHTMTNRKTAERIAIEYLMSVKKPKSSVEIKDEICRKTKHGISSGGLKGILNERNPKFVRAGTTNKARYDGSTYDVQLWSLPVV